jgi:hypothetical protein
MNPDQYSILKDFAGPAATVIASLTAASVAIAFGLFQARIAKRQAKIANDKLALDLFQRRIDAIAKVREAIGAIVRSGASSSKVEIDLLEGIDAARFLFGPDVREYLDKLYGHLLELDLCNKMLNGQILSPQERANAAQSRADHFKAISSFYEKINDLFGPYLLAGHIKFSK